MPLARIASWTRRQGCILGPPASPSQTYRVGMALPALTPRCSSELVDPGHRLEHPVAALGPIRPDGDQLEAILARLEGPDRLRAYATHVPTAERMDFVVEPDSSRTP